MREATGRRTEIRWYNSLIARVIALCIVLVLCLLGLAYVLTEQYHTQVIESVNAQAKQVTDSFEIMLEAHTGAPPPLENIPETFPELHRLQQAGKLKLEVLDEGRMAGPITLHPGGRGYIYSQVIQYGDSWIELTATLDYDPQTEVIRAFSNRYLFGLTAAFFVTLGLMVYLIARTLTPLRELSESCAQISEGNLKDVAARSTSGEILALEETFNRMVGSLREKEKVEANLRQAQRLSAIGNLAAGVAHDVRNPLNAIKLLTSNVLDTLKGSPDQERTSRQLMTIREEVRRLEDIVAGFLSLAKEEELKMEKLSIDPLIEECVNLVRKDAEERQVRLLTELRAGDIVIHVDPKQWKRALLNVLINALEACVPGGRVRVFSRVVDEACEVEIRDDGRGVPEEALEHVFDPYFTTKTTGTGLGLSITRGIIEEHGGSIRISSSVGHGSQVLIRMPLETPLPV